MSVTWLRDTTSYMAEGIALEFWLRVERERVAKDWSASRLSTETARYTPKGKPIPRSTIDNLKTSTRAPQPYIVRALTSALGIDYEEGAVLAGVLRPKSGSSGLEQVLADNPDLTDEDRQIIRAVHDKFVRDNRAASRRTRQAETSDDLGRSDGQQRAV